MAEILICSNEYLSLPVRRSDEEPLQKLTTELRGELDVKARARCTAWHVSALARRSEAQLLQQDPKFQKLHPPCKKALILLHAQVRAHGCMRMRSAAR